jgi:tetratricopeptide (TPR) repeat protein
MSEKISLYNPRDTLPEQLEAMLVGREPLLQEILDSLRAQVDAPARTHWVLRGQRGIGKTHLTGILHHRIQTDPTLAKAYLPLWLGEADVYEVYSPATLLLCICERLVEEVPEAPLAGKLRSRRAADDEDAFFSELAAQLTAEAERQGRVLLVLLENLDALFESFAPKQRAAQTGQLRTLLLNNPRLLFISTTPIRYIQELSGGPEPLFAHLEERQLSPLTVEEVGVLFTKLTRLTGRKELLGEGTDAALKQRIIHQLTGGLPRSVIMAFEILRDKEGIQVLVEDLRTFLDAQTAYFEARLSRLAPRERAIVTTLALADQNLTLKEIAEESLLPEKSLSTHVARLEQEGHVEAMEGTGGKGTLYGLSEGLFRIWYQYRKGRLLLEPLVRFLAYWYEPQELQEVAETMQQRATQEGPVTRTTTLTLLQIQMALQLATSERGRLERERLWEECRRAVEETSKGKDFQAKYGEMTRELGEVIGLLVFGKEKEAGATLDRFLAGRSDPTVWKSLVCQVFLQTILQSPSKKLSTDIAILQFVVDRFGSDPDITVQIMTLVPRVLLVAKLIGQGQHERAQSNVDALWKALKSEPFQRKNLSESARPIFWLAWSQIIGFLQKRKHEDEALRACNEFQQELRGHLSSLEARHHLFAVLTAQARIHFRRRQFEAAEKLAQEALQLQVDTSDELVQSSLVEAKGILVIAGLQTNRMTPREASRVLDEWIETFRQGPQALTPARFQRLTKLRDSIDDIVHQRPAASVSLRTAVRAQEPAELVQPFLDSPRLYIKFFPRQELIQLLRKMLELELPAEQREQLQLHLSAIEFLAAAEAKIPEARQRLKQTLGRVPVEMRSLYQSLLNRVSATPLNEEKNRAP